MESRRLFDLLSYQLKNFPKKDTFASKIQGQWKAFSTREVMDTVDAMSRGLIASGIGKGETVAIISGNRPEWNFTDYAIQQVGAISVPIYPTLTQEDFRFIFEHAGVKLIFVSNEEMLGKVKAAIGQLPNIPEIISFEHIQGVKHWSELLLEEQTAQNTELIRRKENITTDDVVTLIYTSGTTGTPKGVMLSHRNLLTNVSSCALLMPVGAAHKALSFLPLCHVYERMMSYLYVFCGVSIYYAESLETISDNLKEVQPHIFVTVPRLLEKVYDKIYEKGAALSGIKRKLFFWALNLGLNYNINGGQSWFYNFQLSLANKLIFNKWRDALGGHVIAVVSGGAALQPRLAKVFWAARIKVMEGYGLTETSPVICVNRWNADENRIGTVGPVIKDVAIKIAEDGEILTKGPGVMQGYYKREDLTKEVIDGDGWFKTGDIGELVEGRYLKITDRKKEMFKTSGGKYIAPQLIENKFKESRVIEQIMVIGDGQKFPAALIIPSFTGLKAWCEIKDIKYTSDDLMVKTPEVLEKFQKEVDNINEGLAQYEKIKKFELLSKPWTVNSGEMTPTLKLKRKIILANNESLIGKMYHSE